MWSITVGCVQCPVHIQLGREIFVVSTGVVPVDKKTMTAVSKHVQVSSL